MLAMVPKIQALLDAKKTVTKIQEYQSEHKGVSNEIVIMKGSQFDPILEHRKKNKTGGLAAHAIQLPNQKPKAELNRFGSNDSQPREKYTSTSSTEDVVDGILNNLNNEKPSTKQDSIIKDTVLLNYFNNMQKTPTQTQPQSQPTFPREIQSAGKDSKKRSIFEEFSDKNMASGSKGKRKAVSSLYVSLNFRMPQFKEKI